MLPILALAFAATATATPFRRQDDLAARIESQNSISLQGVLNNIGPSGSQAPGASAGVIIASPSTENPDYFFTWTRDAALTMKMLVDEFLQGKTELRSYIQDYVEAQAILQTVSNPSGALGSGRGLGEPKYYTNLTRFNGDWGRPQRDGPALRATALITYSRWLLSSGNDADASEAADIWPVIQNDLNYVAQYWNTTGFDLWEEVRGSSVFATAAQHRALIEGTALGKQLGKDTAAYESQAPNVLCFLQSYWNGEYDVANINVNQEGYSRTGLDSDTVLASIATFDPEAECSDALFQPCSAHALSNLKAYIDSFRTIYAINNGSTRGPVAVGRYAEDVYFNGNPWYITTVAVAEQLYSAVQQWNTLKTIAVSETSLSFWQSVASSAALGTYESGSQEFSTLITAALEYADGFISIALKYIPSSGALAEQFSRENGTALSARDLTWSYASFVTARNARVAATSNGTQVPSWGAPSSPSIPTTCSASSVVGSYAPAVAAGAPDITACTILVTFNLNATTFFGENLYLVGNTTDLGEGRTSDSLAGSAAMYSSDRPLWSFVVELPASSAVQYNYVRHEPDGSWIFDTANRTAVVPECAQGPGVGNSSIEDAWAGPNPVPPGRFRRAL